MANSERLFPKEWICESGIDVEDAFIDYAMPLIGERSVEVPLQSGLPRFARLNEVFASQQCDEYVPQAHRKA